MVQCISTDRVVKESLPKSGGSFLSRIRMLNAWGQACCLANPVPSHREASLSLYEAAKTQRKISTTFHLTE